LFNEIYLYYFLMGLILFPIAMIFYVTCFQGGKRDRSVDLYGFKLDGWNLLKDDSKLYEIELDFEQELVAKSLKQIGRKVQHWHSNLISKDRNEYTGFLSVMKLNIGTTADLDGDIGFSATRTDFSEYRYYRADLNHEELHLINICSSNSAADRFSKLRPITTELDDIFGLTNWNIISYRKKLYIIVPEVFEKDKLLKFLDLSRRVKLSLEE